MVEEIKKYLKNDEKVLKTIANSRFKKLSVSDLPSFIVSFVILFVFGFIIFFAFLMMKNDGIFSNLADVQNLIYTFGLVFVLICWIILFVYLIILNLKETGSLKSDKCMYFITNKRVCTLKQNKSSYFFNSLDFDEIVDIKILDNPIGVGTIVFSTKVGKGGKSVNFTNIDIPVILYNYTTKLILDTQDETVEETIKQYKGNIIYYIIVSILILLFVSIGIGWFMFCIIPSKMI